jgi:hypothetical protein
VSFVVAPKGLLKASTLAEPRAKETHARLVNSGRTQQKRIRRLMDSKSRSTKYRMESGRLEMVKSKNPDPGGVHEQYVGLHQQLDGDQEHLHSF